MKHYEVYGRLGKRIHLRPGLFKLPISLMNPKSTHRVAKGMSKKNTMEPIVKPEKADRLIEKILKFVFFGIYH